MHLNLLFFKIKYTCKHTQNDRTLKNYIQLIRAHFQYLLLFVKLFANLKWTGWDADYNILNIADSMYFSVNQTPLDPFKEAFSTSLTFSIFTNFPLSYLRDKTTYSKNIYNSAILKNLQIIKCISTSTILCSQTFLSIYEIVMTK